MKRKPPILAILVILHSVGLQHGQAQPPQTRNSTQRQSTSANLTEGSASPTGRPAGAAPGSAGTDPPVDTTTEGGQLIRDAALAVFRRPSISARISQRIDMFGQQMVGRGRYLQQGSGSEILLRLELTMPVGNQSSILQVCDGRHLWIHQDLPGDVRLSRVDLDQVRGALKDSPHVDPTSVWLALGGLPKLIHELDANFRFSAPRAARLRDQPVWVIRGTWKRAKLITWLPDQKDAITAGETVRLDKLPEQLPTSVTVWLGQDDLFPYRIEHRRQVSTEAAGVDRSAVSKETTMSVTMDLVLDELQRPIEPLRFVYKPGDQNVTDQTQQFLLKLHLIGDSHADAQSNTPPTTTVR